MGTVIKTKRGSGFPANGTLKFGELGIDTDSNALYYGDASDNTQLIATGVTLGGGSSDGQVLRWDPTGPGAWLATSDILIASTGEVGIGLPAGGVQLTVLDQVRAEGTSSPRITTNHVTPALKNVLLGAFLTNSQDDLTDGKGGGGVRVYAEEDWVAGANKSYLRLATGNGSGGVTDRIHIGSNGRVGIGTFDPLVLLDVRGNILASSHLIVQSFADAAIGVVRTQDSSGANVGQLSVSGMDGLGAPSTWSFQSNIQLVRIQALDGISGVWNDNGGTVHLDSSFQVLTQAQYDAITPDSDVIYFISG